MNRIHYLSGKVTRQALPALQPPTVAQAPALKRLLLPQGELAQFHDGDPVVHYIAAIQLKSDTVRGNHYHDEKQEWIYVLSGEMLLVVKDLESGEREQLPLAPGDLVYIAPRVAHAMQVLTPGFAIEFSPNRYNPADTFRTALI